MGKLFLSKRTSGIYIYLITSDIIIADLIISAGTYLCCVTVPDEYGGLYIIAIIPNANGRVKNCKANTVFFYVESEHMNSMEIRSTKQNAKSRAEYLEPFIGKEIPHICIPQIS